jgi:hypothetical protein
MIWANFCGLGAHKSCSPTKIGTNNHKNGHIICAIFFVVIFVFVGTQPLPAGPRPGESGARGRSAAAAAAGGARLGAFAGRRSPAAVTRHVAIASFTAGSAALFTRPPV